MGILRVLEEMMGVLRVVKSMDFSNTYSTINLLLLSISMCYILMSNSSMSCMGYI